MLSCIFPYSMLLAIGLSYITFIILRYIPSILNLFSSFTVRKCWILSNAFSVSIKTVMWFLPQVHWCVVRIDLFTLSSPWTSEMKPTRSQQMILSVCSWIQSANILLRISALMCRNIILKLFFVVSLSDFDMRVIIASLVEFAVFLFFFSFVFEKYLILLFTSWKWNKFALSFISTMMSCFNTSSVQYVTHRGLETLKFVSQN